MSLQHRSHLSCIIHHVQPLLQLIARIEWLIVQFVPWTKRDPREHSFWLLPVHVHPLFPFQFFLEWMMSSIHLDYFHCFCFQESSVVSSAIIWSSLPWHFRRLFARIIWFVRDLKVLSRRWESMRLLGARLDNLMRSFVDQMSNWHPSAKWLKRWYIDGFPEQRSLWMQMNQMILIWQPNQ